MVGFFPSLSKYNFFRAMYPVLDLFQQTKFWNNPQTKFGVLASIFVNNVGNI